MHGCLQDNQQAVSTALHQLLNPMVATALSQLTHGGKDAGEQQVGFGPPYLQNPTSCCRGYDKGNEPLPLVGQHSQGTPRGHHCSTVQPAGITACEAFMLSGSAVDTASPFFPAAVHAGYADCHSG
jgi:hypothetical protein